MTFAGSIFLIAIGAILRFATHIHVKGLDLRTIGLILMIVGIIGLVISLFFLGEWRSRHRAVIEERPVVRDREYY